MIKLPNPKYTASFDVDPQKTFTPLCPNELPIHGGDTIASALNEQAANASIRVLSKESHPTNAEWLDPTNNSNDNWPAHAMSGSYGAELISGLPDITEYDYVVWKGIEANLHPYGSCFHDIEETLSTGVIEFLKNKGITNVIIGGLALDYCVKVTALQLKKAGFEVIVNLSATRGLDPEQTKLALTEFTANHIATMTLS